MVLSLVASLLIDYATLQLVTCHCADWCHAHTQTKMDKELPLFDRLSVFPNKHDCVMTTNQRRRRQRTTVAIGGEVDLVPRPRSSASDGRRRQGSPRLAEFRSRFRVSLERDTHTGGEALTGRNRHRRQHGRVKSIADTADNLAFVAISRQGPSLTPARCRCRASSAMGHLREWYIPDGWQASPRHAGEIPQCPILMADIYSKARLKARTIMLSNLPGAEKRRCLIWGAWISHTRPYSPSRPYTVDGRQVISGVFILFAISLTHATLLCYFHYFFNASASSNVNLKVPLFLDCGNNWHNVNKWLHLIRTIYNRYISFWCDRWLMCLILRNSCHTVRLVFLLVYVHTNIAMVGSISLLLYLFNLKIVPFASTKTCTFNLYNNIT